MSFCKKPQMDWTVLQCSFCFRYHFLRCACALFRFGTKTTWLRFGKPHGSAINTYFGCHTHRWQWSDFTWKTVARKTDWNVSRLPVNLVFFRVFVGILSPGSFENIQWCDSNSGRPFGSLVGCETTFSSSSSSWCDRWLISIYNENLGFNCGLQKC